MADASTRAAPGARPRCPPARTIVPVLRRDAPAARPASPTSRASPRSTRRRSSRPGPTSARPRNRILSFITGEVADRAGRRPPTPSRSPRRTTTSGARCSGSSSRPSAPTSRPRRSRSRPTSSSRWASSCPQLGGADADLAQAAMADDEAAEVAAEFAAEAAPAGDAAVAAPSGSPPAASAPTPPPPPAPAPRRRRCPGTRRRRGLGLRPAPGAAPYPRVVPDRLPHPGPSFLREQEVRIGDRRLEAGMAKPVDGPDDWWLAILWVADADGVVSFHDVAPAAGPPPEPPLLAHGPVVRRRAVGADPRGGRPAGDPARAARPARTTTPGPGAARWRSGPPSAGSPRSPRRMRPNQLADQVLAGFGRAVEDLRGPEAPDPARTGQVAAPIRSRAIRPRLRAMGDLFDEFMRELERRRAEAEGRAPKDDPATERTDDPDEPDPDDDGDKADDDGAADEPAAADDDETGAAERDDEPTRRRTAGASRPTSLASRRRRRSAGTPPPKTGPRPRRRPRRRRRAAERRPHRPPGRDRDRPHRDPRVPRPVRRGHRPLDRRDLVQQRRLRLRVLDPARRPGRACSSGAGLLALIVLLGNLLARGPARRRPRPREAGPPQDRRRPDRRGAAPGRVRSARMARDRRPFGPFGAAGARSRRRRAQRPASTPRTCPTSSRSRRGHRRRRRAPGDRHRGQRVGRLGDAPAVDQPRPVLADRSGRRPDLRPRHQLLPVRAAVLPRSPSRCSTACCSPRWSSPARATSPRRRAAARCS